MNQFIQAINLKVSADSLNQGEDAVRQELALQLYIQNVFTKKIRFKAGLRPAALTPASGAIAPLLPRFLG